MEKWIKASEHPNPPLRAKILVTCSITFAMMAIIVTAVISAMRDGINWCFNKRKSKQ